MDFTPSMVQMMDQMMDACEFKTRKELFDNAFTIFLWAVRTAQEGKDVGSFDTKTGVLEKIKFPALQAAAYNKNSNLMTASESQRSKADATVIPMTEKPERLLQQA
jgi:hypothetical protein